MLRSFPRCLRNYTTPFLAAALAALALTAGAAQSTPELRASDDPAVWAETEVPPPPAFSTSQLINIDLGPNVALKFGLDPKSVSIGKDDVVRYVVVATSPGATTGLYEGIRCATGEVKTYGRYNDGQWNLAKSPEWSRLFGNGAYRHSLALARMGACEQTSPPRSAQDMVRNIKYPRAESTH
ncbi:hypothetical protein RD110_19075 [Rhodoferax koreense]|uniref:CNP1-like uncharacterized domain-containing protein n=1 Tax=Rhodoferax koreensis TaxID=1842727 RepID=A0A1P8JZ69_9BURK|nr:CNP1-like family protein [Rhodoferax koreense]APW39052.1 hypothetical protein RD110_19075 [Rhodoferax koreense]